MRDRNFRLVIFKYRCFNPLTSHSRYGDSVLLLFLKTVVDVFFITPYGLGNDPFCYILCALCVASVSSQELSAFSPRENKGGNFSIGKLLRTRTSRELCDFLISRLILVHTRAARMHEYKGKRSESSLTSLWSTFQPRLTVK